MSDVQGTAAEVGRQEGGARVCSFAGCGRKVDSHGLCLTHARQQQRGQTLQPIKPRHTPGQICAFEPCGRPVESYGLCRQHRRQQREGKKLKPVQYQRPNDTDPIITWDEQPCPVEGLGGPCFIYRGYVDKTTGYGAVEYQGKNWTLQRYVWTKQNGPIPPGMVADHLCMVRACCNPHHLRVVTRAINNTENSNSAAARNKQKTCCDKGHPFTPENTRIRIIRGRKTRRCLACTRWPCNDVVKPAPPPPNGATTE